MPEFTGFPRSIEFLKTLTANNERDWFNANKDRYEAEVRGPALDFINSMGSVVEGLSDHFTAVPTKVGGSLMRVYRDTRFGRDKTPYKTNIGIQFRHEQGKDIHAPGYYVHIAPDECFLGAGIWHPEPAALKAIRERIQSKPEQWQDGTAALSKGRQWALSGDSLKRAPKGIDPDHSMIEDLRRKDFIAISRFDPDQIVSKRFINLCKRRFQRAESLMQFLCDAQSLRF